MEGILSYLTTFIIVVGTVTLIFLVRFFFRNTLESTKKWPYQRQLLTAGIVLLGLFLAIGFLPMDHLVKNQILSVLGILISAVLALSSTTLVGNAMAGIMLRMMHEFRGGDFIEVDDLIGRVTDFGIFHTEIQQVNRDVVSIPNLLLVQKAVKVTRRDGTFINLAVSLGYTVDHIEAEEALKEAALSCKLSDPFVFIEEFLDHAVRYRLYGLLEEPTERLSKTSELHKSVLQTLPEKGMEIASPTLMDRREFDKTAQYIPKASSQSKAPPKEEPIVEEKVFDKADEAQSLEDLRQVHEKLKKKQGTLKNGEDKAQKTKLEEEIKAVTKEISLLEEQKKEE
ncbi:MAG: mechanosensitive ion channel [Spirochaetales bacterium]|jgi:small conductance mechanosensitive channel|nr:mechanosensitive ion channel [Spirochaetales bacterium]